MEPYGNMNTSNGRNCRNSRNQNGRNFTNQNCNQCSAPPNRGRQPGMDCRGRQENNSRGVEMECVCRVTEKQNCFQNDPMDRLGDQFPPVMAYVPWQQWGELYDADCALMQGTLFKELNLIFCGVRC
ncbi:MAG: spore coat associated protein CotJA [Clostridium sp.]|nr:spore coat associated protein CotJA [Clostridium sp.]